MSFPQRTLVSLLVLAVLASACTDDDGAPVGAATTAVDASTPTSTSSTTSPSSTSTTVPAPPDLPEPVLEPRECDRQPAEGVEATCHWLVVPANRANPASGTLQLAVTVLHATSEAPLPDPVVYLSGGPGGDGGSPEYWSTTPMIAERDVIVYDQRGTGSSEPDMNCPEMEESVIVAFGNDASYEEEAALVRESVLECHNRLIAEGVDLNGFSTTESAADLNDLRIALGYDEWNLFGISYGTRLAQEALRRHPEGIRSVILDSTYPMNEASVSEAVTGAQRSFTQLAEGCAADAGCAETYGDDLLSTLDAVVALYDAEPHRSTVTIENLGEIDIVITGSDIVAGLFTALYDTALIPVLPAFLSTLATGDGALIDQVAIQGIPRITGLAEGLALTVNCADSASLAEEVAAIDGPLLAEPGQWASFVTAFNSGLCDEWTHSPASPDFADPVTSDLPILILSGTYDPVTSTPEAETVADALTNPIFVTFDGQGHGVWNESECATALLLTYLADPSAALDPACAAEIGPPNFS